jgi:hypothetical protein
MITNYNLLVHEATLNDDNTGIDPVPWQEVLGVAVDGAVCGISPKVEESNIRLEDLASRDVPFADDEEMRERFLKLVASCFRDEYPARDDVAKSFLGHRLDGRPRNWRLGDAVAPTDLTPGLAYAPVSQHGRRLTNPRIAVSPTELLITGESPSGYIGLLGSVALLDLSRTDKLHRVI